MRSQFCFLFFILLALPAAAGAVDSAEVLGAISALGNVTLDSAARSNISNYINQSTNPVVHDGLLRILEKERQAELIRLRATVKKIRIDGIVREWAPENFEIQDRLDDWYAIKPSREIKRKRAEFDILSYGFATDAKYLYVMLKPAKMPRRKKHYHAVNLMNSRGNHHYVIAWTESGQFLWEYDSSDNSYLRTLTPRGMKSTARKAFEARVPLRALKNLPDYYHVGAIAWDRASNAYNNIWPYSPDAALAEKYKNYALELFARYAESASLVPDNPLPLAQALADSYIYRMVDRATRERVVSDGLTMLEAAASSETYSFELQPKLSQLSLDQIVAWSNRAALYGVDNNSWKFRAALSRSGEKYTEEIYRFLFLDPEIFNDARELISRYGLVVPGDLAATMRKIEEAVVSRQHYRAGVDFLAMLLRLLGTEYWRQIYEEAKYEQDNNLAVATEVADVPIYNYGNWSANFQVRYFNQNDTHYGNCGDVTTMSLAIAKALGIPGLHIHYDLLDENYYQVVHSFPAYYSRQEDRYIGFRRGDNYAWDWARGGREDLQVYYFYDLPIQEWFAHFNYSPYTGTRIWSATSYKAAIVDLDGWQALNSDGFPNP